MLQLSGKEIKNYVVFDIECSHDVDGKVHQFGAAHRLGNAVTCTQDHEGDFRDWIGGVHPTFNLFKYLAGFEGICGYNILGFDMPLLGGELLGEYNLKAPKYLENCFKGKIIDLCIDFKEALGVRVSLASVAEPTLGQSKTMDGGFAPSEFRKGKVLEVVTYCRQDVNLTALLLKMACAGQELKVKDKQGNIKGFKCTPKFR